MNLLNLCALALPGSRDQESKPTSITCIAPEFHDHLLVQAQGSDRQSCAEGLEVGERWEAQFEAAASTAANAVELKAQAEAKRKEADAAAQVAAAVDQLAQQRLEEAEASRAAAGAAAAAANPFALLGDGDDGDADDDDEEMVEAVLGCQLGK